MATALSPSLNRRVMPLRAPILEYFGASHSGHYSVEGTTVSQVIGEGDAEATISWSESDPAAVSIYVHLAKVRLAPRSGNDAAVLANLLNFGVPVGYFRVDPEDGVVMLHHSFFVQDGTLSSAQVGANYVASVNSAMEAAPAFLALAAGASIEDAYMHWTAT